MVFIIDITLKNCEQNFFQFINKSNIESVYRKIIKWSKLLMVRFDQQVQLAPEIVNEMLT